MTEKLNLTGYRRENGKIGIRNHVIILPVDDLSNAAAEGVARLIRGVKAIPHPYGRLQFGDDLDLTFRTLIGTGQNPNVAAVIVVGIEPKWTEKVVEGIAETGKPVTGFSVERSGDLRTVQEASRRAMEYLQWASEQQREPVEASDFLVSAKCGESDTTLGLASNPTVGRVLERLIAQGAGAIFGETSELTGGEDMVAAQAATPEVSEQFMEVFQAYQDFITSTGADLFGSQPTQGNIRGGLSTIEEKAYGNIAKMGRNKVQSVLAPAQAPAGPGLHYMDTSSAAAEMVTLCAAAGSIFHFFTTGQGNIVGNPIVPVLKISANPLTVKTMSEHIDVDICGLFLGSYGLDVAADRVEAAFEKVARGRLTAAEALGHEEFVLTKLYRSA